jgi:hypothetical protein
MQASSIQLLQESWGAHLKESKMRILYIFQVKFGCLNSLRTTRLTGPRSTFSKMFESFSNTLETLSARFQKILQHKFSFKFTKLKDRENFEPFFLVSLRNHPKRVFKVFMRHGPSSIFGSEFGSEFGLFRVGLSGPGPSLQGGGVIWIGIVKLLPRTRTSTGQEESLISGCRVKVQSEQDLEQDLL